MKKKSMITRRDFLSSAAAVGAGSTIPAIGLLSSCSGSSEKPVPLKALSDVYIPNLDEIAIDGKPLKAGLIGCGPRGTGAASNFLEAAPNVQIVAFGDIFQDEIDKCRKALKTNFNIDFPDEMCFTGFDSYKKVIDSGVDLVILATPPAFRPTHFEAAVEAGKHAFLEKPGCVDPTGYRILKASAKKAEAQGLCVVAGTQRRYQRSYVESFKQIRSGIIGEIVSGSIYWNRESYFARKQNPGESDMEFMIRTAPHWSWLSGDIIGNLMVHNIDVMTWFIGVLPISATGAGSQQRRTVGDNYDVFNIEYVYEGGIHVSSMCRDISGCTNRFSDFLQGTKGSWEMSGGNAVIHDLRGNVVWDFKTNEKERQRDSQVGSKTKGPYTLEHIDFINHIRNNSPINQAIGLADSSLTAVLGRISAYTGKTVTWDEISNSSLNLLPEKQELGPMDMSKYGVPVPGVAKVKTAGI